MDPDETLRQLREDVAAFTVDNDPADAILALSRFADLDEWLTKGGFLPAAWGTIRFPAKED